MSTSLLLTSCGALRASWWLSKRLGAVRFTSFWRSVCLTLLSLAALASLRWVVPVVARGLGAPAEQFSQRLLAREDHAANEGGYYEVLLNDGARVGGNTLLDAHITARSENEQAFAQTVRLKRNDFMLFGFEPNTYQEFTWLRTNSFGMADREHTLAKPPGVRRIAIFGDSMARGFGARPDRNWTSLLEHRLNADFGRLSGESYEVLNFGLDGACITQMVDQALEQAPAFDPDVYVLALSDKRVTQGRWSVHLAQLLANGRDLKYDFLKQVATDARVSRGASAERDLARLAPMRERVFGWAMSEIRSHAEARGASVLAVELTSVDYAGRERGDFDAIRAVTEASGVPTIDLSDTFLPYIDREALRFHDAAVPQDPHPNSEGYRLIFENLYRKVIASPTLLRLIRGF